MTSFKIAISATLIASVFPLQAFAHTSFVTGTAEQESTIVAALQVPHGCEGGQATTEVQVKLPEGFISAKPQPKAGWELEIISGDYQKAYKNHGTDVTKGPIEIRWKSGNLPDAFYDTFNVQGKISGIDAGTNLPFKVTQLCGDKGKAVWDKIAEKGQDPHALDNPAPVIRVTAKQMEEGEGHSNAHGNADMADASTAKAGDLELSAAVAKVMLPSQPVGGGSVVIKNDGKSEDRLMAVESPVAGRAELHEMVMAGDVMKMRKITEGLAIPAGQTMDMDASGYHFMFYNVKKPFADGDKIPVTLTFEKTGKVEVQLSVGAVKGDEPQHKHN